MNKEELKSLNVRLGEYFRNLVTNDREIADIKWTDAHLKTIDISRTIIRLILEEEKPKSKAADIRSLVNKLCLISRLEGREAEWMYKDHKKQLEKELDELLKDL